MRRVVSFLIFIALTIVLSTVAIFLSLFDRRGRVIHDLSRFWARLHLKMNGITVDVSGLRNVTAPPYIFMCNHQSALDIFVLLVSLPVPFKWIAKRELFFIPFLGWAMKGAGYISLDRGNPREALKAIEGAAAKIRGGMNIILFPEGTRSKDGILLPFKKGVFSLALRSKVPIVPVGIYGTSRLQPKGSFFPKQKGRTHVGIGKPIPTAEESRSAKTRIMLDVRREIEQLMEDRQGRSQ
ncbi:MAG: 1-acyl-sn-glycerol-3-phosphate acyltransferase [Syntrophorhabdus aromaticivorans]|uniref:1-acyl-sn-glycerol-3-phosphate acyltransferase n=1 Tax=Syntrophorhabdus aromaticivorans TaxID=328301 RepID=A0A971M684_9BACT|nr:1-acyl-sn-glycerol-3-phosphate acyltransferase [Syntrophorhabdus aromaticivorans]